MQGRLSPIVDGRIQSFPWGNWENEITIAPKIGLNKIEWTVDSHRLQSNPIMQDKGIKFVSELLKANSVSIPSVTSDYFMENPPWIMNFNEVLSMHKNICHGMGKIGSRILVIPLVDNSSLTDHESITIFRNFVYELEDTLNEFSIKIAIESDYTPRKLLEFVSSFEDQVFGINYDIGNSASLGFDAEDEIENYGRRILNVHVKDRILGGTTVPLGSGNANLPKTLNLLEKNGYSGNYILQTARSHDEKHVDVIVEYSKMVEDWLHAGK